MKLVVDLNLSPRWIPLLKAAGFDACHWSDVGAVTASDEQIIAWARIAPTSPIRAPTATSNELRCASGVRRPRPWSRITVFPEKDSRPCRSLLLRPQRRSALHKGEARGTRHEALGTRSRVLQGFNPSTLAPSASCLAPCTSRLAPRVWRL
jgi:hypothetical protein